MGHEYFWVLAKEKLALVHICNIRFVVTLWNLGISITIDLCTLILLLFEFLDPQNLSLECKNILLP